MLKLYYDSTKIIMELLPNDFIFGLYSAAFNLNAAGQPVTNPDGSWSIKEPVGAALFSTIPKIFLEQANTGYNKFYLNIDHLDTQAVGGDGTRLFDIQIIDPERVINRRTGQPTGEVRVKFGLRAIFMPDTSVQPMSKDGERTDIKWLPGHRSYPYNFGQTSVEEGLLTQSEFDRLLENADEWAAQVAMNQGDRSSLFKDAAFRKECHLYLAPFDKNASFYFTYGVNNWKNTSYTIGIRDIEMKGLQLIGARTGIGSSSVKLASEAPKVADKLFQLIPDVAIHSSVSQAIVPAPAAAPTKAPVNQFSFGTAQPAVAPNAQPFAPLQ